MAVFTDDSWCWRMLCHQKSAKEHLVQSPLTRWHKFFQILWDWEMYERTVATNVFANKATITHADHNNEKQTSEEGFIRHQFHPYCAPFSVLLKDRHDGEESLLFYVVVSELVGGTRGSKKEEKEERVCAVGKKLTARRFENSLNGAAPK